MGIYPPANDVCQDAAFLFKDRTELIRWVYGEAWEISSVKVWVLTSFGVWQIDLSLAELLLQYYAIRLDWRSLFDWRHRIDSAYTSGGVLSPYRRSPAGNYSWR